MLDYKASRPLFFFGLLFVVIGAIILVFPYYRSEVKLALVFTSSPNPEDFADTVRAARTMQETMIEVVQFSDFRNMVFESGFNAVAEMREMSDKERGLFWDRHVSIKPAEKSLVVSVGVWGSDKKKTAALSEIIAQDISLLIPDIVGGEIIRGIVGDPKTRNVVPFWFGLLIFAGGLLIIFINFPLQEKPAFKFSGRRKPDEKQAKKLLQDFLNEHK